MSEISPSIPFHLARAYATAPTLVAGRRTVIEARPPEAEVRQAPARLPSKTITRLVAARVPGGIDFTAGDCSDGSCQDEGKAVIKATISRTEAAALPFYRHPADKNAAATSIATAGLVLDTLA